MPVTARFTDGQTSRITDVTLDLAQQGLRVIGPTGNVLAAWSYTDICVVQDWENALGGMIGHKRISGAALTFDSRTSCDALVARLGKPDRKTFIIPLSISSIVLSLCVVIAVIAVSYPLAGKILDEIAYHIPPEAEKKLGEVSIRVFAQEFEPCDDKAANASLQKIMTRLTSVGDIKGQKIDMHLYRTSMVNAFAFPGNNMAVLSGFLQKTQSEEEVAGVLAHELGHIKNRDAMRLTLQSGGFRLLSTLMTGSDSIGNIGGAAAMMHTIQYTREKETAADAYAADLLPRAGYSKRGLANFLARMISGKDGETIKALEENLSFLSNHPATQDRVNTLNAGKDTGKTRYSLTHDEFLALKNACRVTTPQQAPKSK